MEPENEPAKNAVLFNQATKGSMLVWGTKSLWIISIHILPIAPRIPLKDPKPEALNLVHGSSRRAGRQQTYLDPKPYSPP